MVDMTTQARFDPYRVLGVPATATTDELRDAYRRRIRETHPDLGGDPTTASDVNRAWDLVGDPDARIVFDADRARENRTRARATDPDATADEPRPHRPGWPTAAPTATATGGRDRRREYEEAFAAGQENLAREERIRKAHADYQARIDESAAETAEWSDFGQATIRDWWKNPILWVIATAWTIAAIVYVILGGVSTVAVWAAAGALGVAAWTPTFRRGWKLPAVAIIAACVIDVFLITPFTPLTILLASTVAAWVAVWWARQDELASIRQVAWERYAHACTEPGVAGWHVIDTEPGTSSTRCLLEHENTGQQTTRTLWGLVRPGDRVALIDGDTSDVPLAVLPLEAQNRPRTWPWSKGRR